MATGFNTQVGNGEYRLQFETDKKEHYLLMQETARRCVDWNVNTNADRIRAMSDEELAEFISNCGCPDHARSCKNSCEKCTLEWLKQPVEEQ